MPHLSDGMRLMLAPAREYRARARTGEAGSWIRACRTPCMVAVMLATTGSIAAAGSITLRLFASSLLSWSFVPVLQFTTSAVVAGRAPARAIGLPRRIELLFDGHAPWALWLVGVAAWLMMSIDQTPALAASIVPTLLTARIVAAFGREVLGLSPQAARRRAAGHALMTWLLILVYLELATSLSSRVGVLRP